MYQLQHPHQNQHVNPLSYMLERMNSSNNNASGELRVAIEEDCPQFKADVPHLKLDIEDLLKDYYYLTSVQQESPNQSNGTIVSDDLHSTNSSDVSSPSDGTSQTGSGTIVNEPKEQKIKSKQSKKKVAICK